MIQTIWVATFVQTITSQPLQEIAALHAIQSRVNSLSPETWTVGIVGKASFVWRLAMLTNAKLVRLESIVTLRMESPVNRSVGTVSPASFSQRLENLVVVLALEPCTTVVHGAVLPCNIGMGMIASISSTPNS